MLRRYAFEMIGSRCTTSSARVGSGRCRTSSGFAGDARRLRREQRILRDDGSTFPAELTVAATRAEGRHHRPRS